MLSTNVLCIKKRKKRSYCISSGGGRTENGTSTSSATEKNKRSSGMFPVTENTPPDMLAGAMDLTVHLPSKRSVKMSVDRSTPMMDLLVQICTNNHLQLSEHTLEALSMLPSNELTDPVLPFKPNTPIGVLDTQHVRVMSKSRSLPAVRSMPTNHQPFESTFRLKVYLPRNQLYVTRVSQSVLLEDIMRKVCEEKNLDPLKYEFRHPGNLDQILDPKLTLSDYQITEIHVVVKGTGNLNQIFSSSDILALKKEEERKQFHNKTGGGVFNLIFKRGTKPSSGSVSSENRSISPTHSDDSRSVTPPQQEIIPTAPMDRPKPPQRKRRPAPKPPQEKPPAAVEQKKAECNGLTICHSRNSSDSSGYHEASILSDNCNTSLPRRPKSTVLPELSAQHSQSTSNLSKMGAHSKSTSSLAFPSRKKKSAPPPPPAVLIPKETPQEPSPAVVASQPQIVVEPEPETGNGQDNVILINTNPIPPQPAPRTKIKPSPRPRSVTSVDEISTEIVQDHSTIKKTEQDFDNYVEINKNVTLKLNAGENEERNVPEVEDLQISAKEKKIVEDEPKINELVQSQFNLEDKKVNAKEEREDLQLEESEMVKEYEEISEAVNPQFNLGEKMVVINSEESKEDKTELEIKEDENLECNLEEKIDIAKNYNTTNNNDISEAVNPQLNQELEEKEEEGKEEEETTNSQLNPLEKSEDTLDKNIREVLELQKQNVEDIFKSDIFATKKEEEQQQKIIDVVDNQKFEPLDSKQTEKVKPPEIVAFIPKPNVYFDSFTRKRGFQIGKALLDSSNSDNDSILTSTPNSVASALNAFEFGDDEDDDNDEISDLDISLFTESLSKNSSSSQTVLNHLHGMHGLEKLNKSTSASSLRSSCSIPGFFGGNNMKKWDNFEELHDLSSLSDTANAWVIGDTSDSDCPPTPDQKKIEVIPPPEEPAKPVEELELDWQYQLPDAPQGFRDSSPVPDVVDSVVTSPELFEKLNVVKDNQSEKETFSDMTSVISEEEKPPILNTLSLENLEKRKSMVYNRELATSLKLPEKEEDTFSTSLTKFEKTYNEIKSSSSPPLVVTKPVVQAPPIKSTLPNFKITTYDNPKQKINIFEDDTIRSNNNNTSLINRNSLNGGSKTLDGSLHKSYQSMENISYKKSSSDEDDSSSRKHYHYLKPPLTVKSFNVSRSESFSTDRTPLKPVTRSKSQVALNKYRENKSVTLLNQDHMVKSISSFDVSGLQSLGVMRQIQNKLNTPTTSTEALDEEPAKSYQEPPEIKREVQNFENKPKIYYTTTPSINMGTWSERPKVPVNVKEDPDYKFSTKDRTNSKLIVNTTNNTLNSHNSIEVRSNKSTNGNNGSVSIKVNGSEPISAQNTGNVVIKIGNISDKPVQLRKPLGNINKIEQQRPHSIAFGGSSTTDLSRVPIVRSVELKKPYKDMQNGNNNNTSITQIYQNNGYSSLTLNRNGYFNNNNTENPSFGIYRSTETLPTKAPPTEPKPVVRVSSFAQNPTVRGFKTMEYRPQRDFSTNKSVPFGQSNLRRTESNRNDFRVSETTAAPPPPPPSMPKLNKVSVATQQRNIVNGGGGDTKEQLLQQIRDFGGKKGLRTVKV